MNEVPPQPRTDGCHGGRHGQRSSEAVENARAAREARESVVHGGRTHGTRWLWTPPYGGTWRSSNMPANTTRTIGAKDDTEATGDLTAEDETPT